MKIKLTEKFKFQLGDIVLFISKDKPFAARNFKNDLISKIKIDCVNPFHFKKSIYFEDESYRDYAFKGYTTILKVDVKQEIVYVIGIVKHRNSF
jgi:ParE toxin of type II toxin-antitoxin system, parDE